MEWSAIANGVPTRGPSWMTQDVLCPAGAVWVGPRQSAAFEGKRVSALLGTRSYASAAP